MAAALSKDVQSELARIGIVLADRKSNVIANLELVKETWSERAAIREYLGGIPRETAERLALRDTCEVLGVRYIE